MIISNTNRINKFFSLFINSIINFIFIFYLTRVIEKSILEVFFFNLFFVYFLMNFQQDIFIEKININLTKLKSSKNITFSFIYLYYFLFLLLSILSIYIFLKYISVQENIFLELSFLFSFLINEFIFKNLILLKKYFQQNLLMLARIVIIIIFFIKLDTLKYENLLFIFIVSSTFSYLYFSSFILNKILIACRNLFIKFNNKKIRYTNETLINQFYFSFLRSLNSSIFLIFLWKYIMPTFYLPYFRSYQNLFSPLLLLFSFIPILFQSFFKKNLVKFSKLTINKSYFYILYKFGFLILLISIILFNYRFNLSNFLFNNYLVEHSYLISYFLLVIFIQFANNVNLYIFRLNNFYKDLFILQYLHTILLVIITIILLINNNFIFFLILFIFIDLIRFFITSYWLFTKAK